MGDEPEQFTAQKLITEGAFFNINFKDDQTEEEQAEDDNCLLENLKYLNLDCVDVADEDVYVEGEPFDTVAAKMHNLYDNKVMKRVLREGYGLKPTESATVIINYNAYIEHEIEPFDSTYARKKPQRFTLNRGEVILGLDLAVQSMRIKEKSQFLIEPEFAYGRNGCLSRIPPNATVLFEVELLAITETGETEKFEQLPEEKQQEFEKVYEYCLALKKRGNDFFATKNYKGAIREYNKARDKLEKAISKDIDEEDKQQETIRTLLINLLICYTKDKEPKKGCICFNTLMDMTRGTNIKVPGKVYYHNAKCLIMLNDYELAMKRLKKAHGLCPSSEEIASEMQSLKELMNEHKHFEKKMAAAFVKK